MKNRIKIGHGILGFMLMGILSLAACTKEESPLSNESEVVSKVMVTLIDSASGNRFMFAYTDPDGDGGHAPEIDTIATRAGRKYHASLRLFDVTLDSTVELTQEIVDEAEAHEFFFVPTGTGLVVRYDENDKDANGIYVGLKTLWSAKIAGQGALKVILKHQPGLKPTAPKPGGDQSLGETDVEVEFPFRIE